MVFRTGFRPGSTGVPTGNATLPTSLRSWKVQNVLSMAKNLKFPGLAWLVGEHRRAFRSSIA
jgi:hypothetical protein